MKKTWTIIISVVAALAVAVYLLVVGGVFETRTVDNGTDPEPAGKTVAAPAVREYDGSADLTGVPSKLTVIDFNATWCGPCRQFAPVLESVARKYGDKADFYSVDVDRFPAVADSYGVTAIPKVVVLFPDGTRHESTGYMDASELEALMQK